MKKETIQKIKELYSKRDNQHNFKHILFIKNKVKILKKEYRNLDNKLLNFLILYHGLKEYVQKNSARFKPNYVKSLMRHNIKPKLLEEKLVFDANMLDNVGKRGIRKALSFGKRIRRNKKETYAYLKDNLHKAKFYTKQGKLLGKKEIKIMKETLIKQSIPTSSGS